MQALFKNLSAYVSDIGKASPGLLILVFATMLLSSCLEGVGLLLLVPVLTLLGVGAPAETGPSIAQVVDRLLAAISVDRSMGVVLGVIVTVNLSGIVMVVEKVLGFKFLAPDVYFISDFPSRIDSGDVIEVALIGIFLSFVSTIIPAWKAATMAPAEALRHD